MEIKDAIKIIKNKAVGIIIVTLTIGCLETFYNYKIVVPIYQAEAKIFIGINNKDNKQYDVNEFKAFKEVITTYVEIIKTNDLINSSMIGSSFNRTSQEILGNLDASALNDTQIIQIKYKDCDQYTCKAILDRVCQKFIDKSKDLMPGCKIEIIENAKIPIVPVYPNKKVNVLISIILGFVFSTLIVLIAEGYGKSLTSIMDIEEATGIKILGRVPKYNIYKENGELRYV